jgi:hypothetical protein
MEAVSALPAPSYANALVDEKEESSEKRPRLQAGGSGNGNGKCSAQQDAGRTAAKSRWRRDHRQEGEEGRESEEREGRGDPETKTQKRKRFPRSVFPLSLRSSPFLNFLILIF